MLCSCDRCFSTCATMPYKQCPGGGKLIISAVRQQDSVVIKIIDNGQGIPDKNLKRLGKKFFTTKEAGTGLGLAISYRIIQQHQGTINVTSEVGKGTEFAIASQAYKENLMDVMEVI